jgi:hypothetical protein
LEYTGWASPSDRVVVPGSLVDRQFVAFWLADDRLVAGMNANVWDVAKPIEAAHPFTGRRDSGRARRSFRGNRRARRRFGGGVMRPWVGYEGPGGHYERRAVFGVGVCAASN